MAKSKKTTKALEAKAAKLRGQLADLSEQANTLAAKIERAPTETIERGKNKVGQGALARLVVVVNYGNPATHLPLQSPRGAHRRPSCQQLRSVKPDSA